MKLVLPWHSTILILQLGKQELILLATVGRISCHQVPSAFIIRQILCAVAAYAKLNFGKNIDDVLVPIYKELGLRHYIRGIQRTTDTNDAWGGYGLSATVNDVIRLAQYLRDEENLVNY